MRARSWMYGCVVGLVLALGWTVPARAESGSDKTLEARRISEPITLDGVLDEEAWAQAPAGTDFVQREPDTGQPASQQTEVRVVYTAKTLYIGIRCLDQEPDRIIEKEMQRDQYLWRDDAVDVVLDTFDDDRNAYLFETNVNAAQTDALITDEGRDFNLEWDAVWDVAAQRTAEGWSAELEIPFSTLRFDPSAEAWGFNVLRYIRRRAEQAFWAPILLDADVKRVSQYGRLTGIRDVEQGWNLNVKPFVVGTLSTSVAADGSDEDDEDLDYGLDVKYGIGRGLSLDATLNTDFGETEVDALQVNLTRFSLFFPEKREFFLENAGIFEFGPGDTSTTPLLKVFFSRRIGINQGEEVPLDWGLRLTGRVGEWNLGILDAQTDSTTVGDGTVEVPRDNWGAIRIARNLGERSSVGMIFTNRDNANSTNRAFGLDLDYNPTDKLSLDVYGVGTDNSGPDGSSDWAGGTALTWTGPVWDWQTAWVRIGDDFDPQMGFLLRRAVNRYGGYVTYEPWPSTPPWIMNYHFKLDAQVYTDLDGHVETEEFRLDLFGMRTSGADEAYLFVTETTEHLSAPFQIGGVEIPVGDYTFDNVGMSFLTHSSRPVSVEGEARAGDFYDGDRLSGSLTLRLRPNRYLRSETTWEVNDIELSAGQFTANIVRERLAVAITPRLLSNLFLQYNDLTEEVSLNFRFNWIYRPGADLFVVYNQTWDAPSLSDLERRDRQLIVKFTYLFQR